MAVLQLLRPGDHVVAMNDLYGGYLVRLKQASYIQEPIACFVASECPRVSSLTSWMPPIPLALLLLCVPTQRFVPLRPLAWYRQLVWIETPTNPLLQIADIKAIATIVRRNPNAILAVDNTFMSSYFQRPLELGAHIEFASVTKYYNGEDQASYVMLWWWCLLLGLGRIVVMGVAFMSLDCFLHLDSIFRTQWCCHGCHHHSWRCDCWEVEVPPIRYITHCIIIFRWPEIAAGYVPSPFDCFLVNRGLKTLHRKQNKLLLF